ncbi:hypothetical protein RJ639_027077 [Escallonia herrerae]|uniref:Uncharacterized protein n=1 Tax=Escallonia herrerae TaxID=1293975 RepID=A0AA89BQ07_9ASTE|nr:hypothetical protein RJ639_027077 [Escallonia herrerae]
MMWNLLSWYNSKRISAVDLKPKMLIAKAQYPNMRARRENESMDYPRLTICFLFILSLITPQPIFVADVCCSDIGNYTTNSTYAANLKTLLSSISNISDLNSDGFFNASIGQKGQSLRSRTLQRRTGHHQLPQLPQRL